MVTQDTARAVRATPGPEGPRAAGAVRFGRHFLEMVLAMVAGMMVFGAAFRGLLAAAGLDYDEERLRFPTLFALVMAFNMTAGMAAWMRHRGHGWKSIAEMGAAMFAPPVVLCPLHWVDVISVQTFFAAQHAAMLPAMLGVMLYRRSDYGHRHDPERGSAHG